MRNFLTRGGYPEKQCQLVLIELNSCLKSVRLQQQRSGSCEPQKLTRELPVLTVNNGCLSDKSVLVFTRPPFHPSTSSPRSCLRMFSHSVIPRALLPLCGHGLVSSQVLQLRSSSVAGYPISASFWGSDCSSRGLGTRASGRRKKDAEMISGEGFKQKAPKTKKRSVEITAAQLSSDDSSGAEAAVGLSRDNRGGIHVIIGPMFAGKSTALLRRVQEEASGGRKVALVKSDKDTRYGLSAIVTHDGLQMPCYAVPDLATFRTNVGDNFYRELDVIGIDEAQFFGDLYQFCQHAADFEGKTVIVAGLDGDFLRRKFGSTLDLVPVADSVVKLSSRCEICGRPAIFSFRKTLDTHTELVGGADVYMPVCRQHFVNGQIVVEVASTVIGGHQVVQLNND